LPSYACDAAASQFLRSRPHSFVGLGVEVTASSNLEAIQFAIDHIAKPNFKNKVMEPWRGFMLDMAKHPGVYCNLSSVITHGDWASWADVQIFPYLD
jgi:predicted TIM-barrel fold metal-dependent hydrolase